MDFFGSSVGLGLDDVRLHTDANAARLAEDLGARAFTVGRDIYFADGQYRPTTDSGLRLLAHEIAHVAQQGHIGQTVQLQDWLPDPGRLAERARAIGRRGRVWGERQVERGLDLGEEAFERAREISEGALEEGEAWWESGTGAVSRIEFDGSTLSLRGSSSYSTSAVSGLKANNPKAGGRNWTDPIHQHVPDKGPIPEGSYYVNPGEVERPSTHHFSPGPWGHYRTRLHASLLTTAERRLFTDRTGGFFVHKDGGNNGTAGCIGITTHAANREVHTRIAANSARIPVEVSYSSPTSSAAPASSTSTGVVQRDNAPASPVAAGSGLLLIQTQQQQAEPPHYLIQAGLDQLQADVAQYGTGSFPSDYYDTLARHLYEEALLHNGRDYGDAFRLLNNLQWGELGGELQRDYTRLVGTDTTNGWDKIRHFIYTAYLQYNSGGFLAPEVFTYGKEIWDAVEGVVGRDPEGYSVPDIRADNRGELFAEQMRARELAEREARTQAELRRMRRVFIEQNPADVLWFMQNLAR